eukprot:30684-Pelagococcus_subviridis.AAC.6
MSPPPEATARFLRRWPLRPVLSVPEPALLFEPFGRPRFFPPSISFGNDCVRATTSASAASPPPCALGIASRS